MHGTPCTPQIIVIVCYLFADVAHETLYTSFPQVFFVHVGLEFQMCSVELPYRVRKTRNGPCLIAEKTVRRSWRTAPLPCRSTRLPLRGVLPFIVLSACCVASILCTHRSACSFEATRHAMAGPIGSAKRMRGTKPRIK